MYLFQVLFFPYLDLIFHVQQQKHQMRALIYNENPFSLFFSQLVF